MISSRRKLLFLAFISCLSTLMPGGVRVFAGDAVWSVSVDSDNVAIQGYDPVAYFTDQKPVRGSSEFESEWLGARWRFASRAHRDLFSSQPESYAPRFGGFCALALSAGAKVNPDPEAWAIIDGKLYLNFDQKSLVIWQLDAESNSKKAEDHWTALNQ